MSTSTASPHASPPSAPPPSARDGGLRPWPDFAAEPWCRERAAFLAEVRVPLLVLWTPLDGAGGVFGTSAVECRTMRIQLAPIVGAMVGARPPSGVALLMKRAGSNAFSQMVTLGRAPNNDVVLPCPAVSKFHAYLRGLGDAWVLSDGTSMNGTTADGTVVTPDHAVRVRSGTRIVLGGAVILDVLDPAHLFDRLLVRWGAGGG